MKKKPLKSVKTGPLSRTLSIATLGLRAGAKAAGHSIGNLFSSEAAQALRKQAHFLEQASLLARELGELKGSLMKAGQMLSVYGEHFLPPEANQILKTLQHQSPPLEWKELHKVAVRQLGKERLSLLEIDPQPLAAASLGQVHRAKVKSNGRSIVLKIQYPGVDGAIDSDIKALKRILHLSEFLPKVPATEGIFAEVKSMLNQELDYSLELSRLLEFRSLLKENKSYLIPEPLPEFSAKRVLAMDYVPGVAIDGAEVAALSQKRRNEIGRKALDLYFHELFVWRKIQTDPHFGNYRLQIGAKEGEDKLVLFDYGAVRELTPEFLTVYRAMLSGIFHSNRGHFEDSAKLLGILKDDDPQELRDLFYRICELIMEPFMKDGAFPWGDNQLPKEVSKLSWQLFRRFPLRSPPREMIFLDRKMAGMFTFLSVLKCDFNGRAVLSPFVDQA
jgi:predicted unusual protein kinase regulating ubiquinone biosynthesis (AarF/ABC1/UbiB family)